MLPALVCLSLMTMMAAQQVNGQEQSAFVSAGQDPIIGHLIKSLKIKTIVECSRRFVHPHFTQKFIGRVDFFCRRIKSYPCKICLLCTGVCQKQSARVMNLTKLMKSVAWSHWTPLEMNITQEEWKPSTQNMNQIKQWMPVKMVLMVLYFQKQSVFSFPAWQNECRPNFSVGYPFQVGQVLWCIFLWRQKREFSWRMELS